MPLSLDFDTSHRYTEAADRINVPLTLSVGRQTVELVAKLDTGAAHCIFERKYAEILGLEVESGQLQTLSHCCWLVCRLSTRGHHPNVWHRIFGGSFFAQDEAFSRNFLGRSGWLDRLRIGIVDYGRTLFLGPYQS